MKVFNDESRSNHELVKKFKRIMLKKTLNNAVLDFKHVHHLESMYDHV